MFGSAAFEVALGLMFVYLVLSVITSHINELLAGVLGWRAGLLEQGIRTLLGDPDLAAKVLSDPLITRGKPGTLPSYVGAAPFALAVFNALIPPTGAPPNLGAIREAAAALPASSGRDAILSVIGAAENQLPAARAGVETWFNDAMDRLTGTYKRRLQWVTLAVAGVVTAIFGVDTIALGNSLWQEQAVRAALTGAAQNASASSVDQALVNINKLGQLIGWQQLPTDASTWGLKAAGLVLTWLAVSLGAPFWFDVLNRVSNLRAAGPKPSEAGVTTTGGATEEHRP